VNRALPPPLSVCETMVATSMIELLNGCIEIPFRPTLDVVVGVGDWKHQMPRSCRSEPILNVGAVGMQRAERSRSALKTKSSWSIRWLEIAPPFVCPHHRTNSLGDCNVH